MTLLPNPILQIQYNLLLQEAQSFYLLEEVYQQKEAEFTAGRKEVVRMLKDLLKSAHAYDDEQGKVRQAFVATMSSYWEEAESCVTQQVTHETHMYSVSRPSNTTHLYYFNCIIKHSELVLINVKIHF